MKNVRQKEMPLQFKEKQIKNCFLELLKGETGF